MLKRIDETYYSRGKLLISGEYFVLENALAFAVPLKYGQKMYVNHLKNETGKIYWKTKVKDKLWFTAIFDQKDLGIVDTNDLKTALYISRLLHKVKTKTDTLKREEFSVRINNNIEFPLEWGLGSSSSLISNIAYWANTNPYDLLFETSEGSGYDIACARSNVPILYHKNKQPVIQEIMFKPVFLENIYFIYLGRKQNTDSSILKYKDKVWKRRKLAKRISEITESMVRSKTLEEFDNYVVEHEEILSETINEPTIKSRLFSNFNGTVKSLGAWGGDFMMATYNGDYEYVKEYFKAKGFDIIFRYNELVA